MAINQVGQTGHQAHVEGLSDQVSNPQVIGVIAFYDITGAWLGTAGHCSPCLQTLKLSAMTNDKEIKGQRGIITGLVGQVNFLSCAFDFVMEGATRAQAALSGSMPDYGCAVAIGNLPVISRPPTAIFADALNAGTITSDTNGVITNAGSLSAIEYPWIFRGEGEITGHSDDAWSGTITLHRFVGIKTWSRIA